MINIGVFDPNIETCEQLETIIRKCFYDFQYTIKYFHISNLLFKENIDIYDLIFLDLDSEDNQGLYIGEQLRNYGYKKDIILYGLTPEYAFEAYSIQPFGYLLKPLSFHELSNVLERFVLFRQIVNKTLCIKDSRKTPKYNISISKIEYIESANTKLTIHLFDKSKIYMYGKLNEVENEINDKNFIRCHQSYLVNINYIKSDNDMFEMYSGVKIPIRARNRGHIKQIFNKYILENK